MLWSQKENNAIHTHSHTFKKESKPITYLSKRNSQVCEIIAQISAMCVTKPICVNLFVHQCYVTGDQADLCKPILSSMLCVTKPICVNLFFAKTKCDQLF